jgi:hypothetical protein
MSAQNTTLKTDSTWHQIPSFPLDGAGGFGGDIVYHAVHAPDMVNNPIGDPA